MQGLGNNAPNTKISAVSPLHIRHPSLQSELPEAAEDLPEKERSTIKIGLGEHISSHSYCNKEHKIVWLLIQAAILLTFPVQVENLRFQAQLALGVQVIPHSDRPKSAFRVLCNEVVLKSEPE